MKYRIRIRALDGNILVFNNVEDYEAKDGLIYFIDEKTKEKKCFSLNHCEIEEMKKR